MTDSYYTYNELKQIGFNSIGSNVLISRNAQFYGVQNISIGNNVRIDDFCILSCSRSLTIKEYIHIGPYSSIIGAGNILIDNFSSISGRVSIYSSSDSYTGLGMTNPMIPDVFRKVEVGDVYLNKHSLIGTGAVLLPNTILDEGAVIGALSLAQGKYNPYTIYSGIPAKELGKRIDYKIKQYEEELKMGLI